MVAPLYRRVLGERIGGLAPQVQALHDPGDGLCESARTWRGQANVRRGRSVVCRVLAGVLGLPPEGEGQPLSVTFQADGEAEIWHRRFGEATFVSRQMVGAGGVILETIGPARLTLVPRIDGDALTLDLARVQVLGLTLPGLLRPIIVTREWEEGKRYKFSVEARLRGLGLLIAYEGWLVAKGTPEP